jgi:dihydrofolate reductase
MGVVYFELSMSLDGFVTGPNVSVDNPLGDGGEHLHDWMFEGKTAEESMEFEEKVFAPSGAIVMGRRMLDLGIGPWGDNPTFHMPVFVVTNRPHDLIVKEGGTTYYFVTDGLEAAFEQARKAAGNKDIAIVGGADIVRQCLDRGLVEEARLNLIPILLGSGTRLFEGVDAGNLHFALVQVVEADGVVHLTYRVMG